MKKKIITVLLFLITLASFAFEGGGLIKTEAGFDISEPAISKKTFFNLTTHERLSLWAKQNMDEEGNYNFSIQGSYFFTASKPVTPRAKRAVYFDALDLDLLKFSFLLFPNKDSSLLINTGRYGFTDNTRVIFDQSIDGIFLGYKQVNFSLFFNAGYTGLLNRLTTPISDEDKNRNTKLYSLLLPVVQSSILLHFPIGKYKHSFDIEAINFSSVRPKGKINNYLTASANGAFMPNFFYIFSLVGQIVFRENTYRLGMSFNGDIAYHFPKFNAKLGVSTQWYSGGKNFFDTFTLTSASKISLIKHSDLWKTSFYSSLKPLDSLSLSTELNILCHGKKQPKKQLYSGIEFVNSINYTILDDILLGLDIGVLHQEERGDRILIGLKGIISF